MKAKPLPPLEFLHECFTYDGESGKLFWNQRPLDHFKTKRVWNWFNNVYAGKAAGAVSKHWGYRKVCISSMSTGDYNTSHIIWKLATGNDPKCYIDHINGDKLDERLSNLREADYWGNNRNAKVRVDNTSGFKGVHFDKRCSKFKAQINIEGKRTYLGKFSTPEEAHEAYKEAASKYHGEFANFG